MNNPKNTPSADDDVKDNTKEKDNDEDTPAAESDEGVGRHESLSPAQEAGNTAKDSHIS